MYEIFVTISVIFPPGVFPDRKFFYLFWVSAFILEKRNCHTHLEILNQLIDGNLLKMFKNSKITHYFIQCIIQYYIECGLFKQNLYAYLVKNNL